MSIRLQLPKVTDLRPRITVLGVGGAGGNAINNMIAAGLQGVDFVVANTDAQALATSSAEKRIQLGTNLTEGLGAGSKPEIGEAAAEEAVDDIRALIAGSHMLFIAAGMGGGTGTGAAAVIARVARELGILTVAVVTKPFQFEGNRRLRVAEAGIAELKGAVDTLIVIPNQNLFRIANERTTFAEAFVLADQVLYSGIACIVDLIIKEGLINLDLADVKTVLAGMGPAMMGTGEATGEDRARLAAEEAIQNPLLDDISLRGAKGLLVSIIGGHDLTLYEVDAAATRVRQEVDPDANIIVGATFDETLGDRVRVSIVASGMARIDPAAGNAPAAGARQPNSLQATLLQPQFAQSSVAGAGHERGVLPNSKAPPPLPGADRLSRPTGIPDHQDIAKRLANALEPGSGYSSQFEGNLSAATGSSLDHSAPDNRGSAGGHRPDGITVEERSPAPTGYSSTRANSYSPQTSESLYDTTINGPAGSSGNQRQTVRAAEIADFPPLAQHEYHARTENGGTNAGQRGPMDYMPMAPEGAVVAPKKASLLQRLTGAGRVRKANATEASAAAFADELPGFLVRNKR